MLLKYITVVLFHLCFLVTAYDSDDETKIINYKIVCYYTNW